MFLASGARVFVVLFATLGLLIEARVLYSLTDSDEWDKVRFLWEIATAPGRFGMLAVFVLPICFYAFCIATCFVQVPRRVLIACVVLLVASSLPVFAALGRGYPTISRNALWTAFWWIPIFIEQLYTKPPVRTASETVTHERDESDFSADATAPCDEP